VASRSQVKRLLDQGHCTVNDQVCRPAKRLKANDRVIITVPPPEPDQALPEAIDLAVLYEDEQVIVVDKPPGMVVHPASGHRRGTLVNALLSHCSGLSGIGGKLRPGIVHRLDKLTSGVMVASKTDEAHISLAEQFARHDVERRYLTVVAGKLAGSGTFDTRHGRHPKDRKRFSGRVERGRRAVTHYRVLAFLRGASLVEATLETGRTHQVRVHFAEAGHAVLGDPIYGRPPRDRVARDRANELGRQALHARVLGFIHPKTGQPLRFASPPPPDMQRLIAALDLEEMKGKGR
jgi:23S rRNA pseudouridine1911/1915/1917 synthase